jgi:hypothetical protein
MRHDYQPQQVTRVATFFFTGAAKAFRISDLGFPLDFGLRISDFQLSLGILP